MAELLLRQKHSWISGGGRWQRHDFDDVNHIAQQDRISSFYFIHNYHPLLPINIGVVMALTCSCNFAVISGSAMVKQGSLGRRGLKLKMNNSLQAHTEVSA